MREARGRFDVQTTPDAASADGIGRFSVAKVFHGDLQGSSAGGMLAVRTQTPGSAGYVLIEQVTGTLEGSTGRFMLQHCGIMDHGQPDLRVVVIPGSGTDGLAGIAGQMSIDAAAGHAYVLRYSLPAEG